MCDIYHLRLLPNPKGGFTLVVVRTYALKLQSWGWNMGQEEKRWEAPVYLIFEQTTKDVCWLAGWWFVSTWRCG